MAGSVVLCRCATNVGSSSADVEANPTVPTQAAAAVLKYAKDAKAKEARLDLAARWLESLDRPADAERLFREFADSSKLADAAGCRSPNSWAVRSVSRKAWLFARKPGNRAIPSRWPTLRSDCPFRDTAEQQQQVDQWIRAALTKHPERFRITVSACRPPRARGNFDEAMAEHRQILQKDRLSIFALNNLANLLALKATHLDEALTLIQRAITVAGRSRNCWTRGPGSDLRQGRLGSWRFTTWKTPSASPVSRHPISMCDWLQPNSTPTIQTLRETVIRRCLPPVSRLKCCIRWNARSIENWSKLWNKKNQTISRNSGCGTDRSYRVWLDDTMVRRVQK